MRCDALAKCVAPGRQGTGYQDSEWPDCVGRDYFIHGGNDDVCYRIAEVLRSRLRQALKDGWRSGSAVGDLGCTIAELKEYLESQFRDGMSWDNYGVVWEIDHVRPLSSFDLTQHDQAAQACHYTNLQPLLIAENRSKHDKT